MADKIDPKDKTTRKSRRRKGEPNVTKVKVLLLTFKHHDIRVVRQETRDVKNAFEELNYTVTSEKIPMTDSAQALNSMIENFLRVKDSEPKNTLYIIYYNGHGYLNTADGQFTMMSHNYPSDRELHRQVPKFYDEMGKIFDSGLGPASQRDMWERARRKFGNLQATAEVAWGDISDTIMDAKCNTLVILDCCNAGLASAITRGDENGESLAFRKELLGACSWGNETQDRMSPALCEALRGIPDPDGAISVSTLVRDMNRILVNQFVADQRENNDRHAPQAVHYVLERNTAERIILDRL